MRRENRRNRAISLRISALFSACQNIFPTALLFTLIEIPRTYSECLQGRPMQYRDPGDRCQKEVFKLFSSPIGRTFRAHFLLPFFGFIMGFSLADNVFCTRSLQ